MNAGLRFQKLQSRIWSAIVLRVRHQPIYPLLYRSWWHIYLPRHCSESAVQYMTAIPNQGAGIGHQIANWISGFWFARNFNCQFAHTQFPNSSWEKFLNFGSGEATVNDLVENQGYKKVHLPLFDEYDRNEIERISKIIASYQGKPIVFVLEYDQSYKDQFGICEEISNKFYEIHERPVGSEELKETFHIAVHVRRGDIVAGQKNGNINLNMRWQNMEYFESVLAKVVECLGDMPNIEIEIFSQGKIEDFSCFKKFRKIIFQLEMGAQESFLRMVKADLLITSKSSFSYKPALLSKGIKVCPKDFWHGYPDLPKWVLVNEDGTFELAALNRAIQLMNGRL